MTDDPNELSPTALPSTEEAAPSQGDRKQIGPYRLLQKLGEGGMGEVWEAEQAEPVRRKVALKLIKAGMDTNQVVARFESERQALAMMSHANIARVFDAGATEWGRPYFAMEYVKGEPITRYCDRHRLPTRERLELFMHVCEGVQHAHQKGIIHRDLKPSNVLVQVESGEPVPKIIDFGVAKATEQRLTEKTLFTQMGVLVGTPEYMSPEQAEMGALDIDTRTDVYSLGVMLYELLIGALPFEPKELRQAGFDEIRRKIREDEPSRPSTRISTLDDEASTAFARDRRTDLFSLRKQLRGDLDWITLRALDKDRTRRYGSPNELAADIGRHLHHEPVLASPPSAAYRMGKFVRRHKVGVSAVAGGLLLLVLGLAGTSYGLIRATRAEAQARQEAATAEQVSEFLVGLFEVSDPSESRGNTITAREILDEGAERIDKTLEHQPLVQARLMGTIGRVYRGLGLYEPARPLLGRALEVYGRELGEGDLSTLSTMNELGLLEINQSRFDEAESLHRQAYETARRVLGEDHPETLRSKYNLAEVYDFLGDNESYSRLHRETLEARRRVLGDRHPETLTSVRETGNVFWKEGRLEEAVALHLEALNGRRRVLGEDHPDTLRSEHTLALVYRDQGRLDESERLHIEALAGRRRVLGDDHEQTLYSLDSLGAEYTRQGRYDDAEPLLVEAYGTARRMLGAAHYVTLEITQHLVWLRQRQGLHEEAESLATEGLQGAKALGRTTASSLLGGAAGAGVLNWMTILADVLCLQGDYEEAAALYLEVIEARRRTQGENDWAYAVWELALVRLEQSRSAEAERLFQEAFATYEKFPPRRAHEGWQELLRARYYALNRDREDALRMIAESIDRGYPRAYIRNHPDLAWLHGDPELEALVVRAREVQ